MEHEHFHPRRLDGQPAERFTEDAHLNDSDRDGQEQFAAGVVSAEHGPVHHILTDGPVQVVERRRAEETLDLDGDPLAIPFRAERPAPGPRST